MPVDYRSLYVWYLTLRMRQRHVVLTFDSLLDSFRNLHSPQAIDQ